MRGESSPIARRAVPAARVAALVVLSVSLAAGAVRLLPWLVAPSVPTSVALPFARGLVAVALETALLAGPPIGWALGAASAVERGEVRALLALGASPSRLILASARGLLPFALVAALAAALWGRDAAAPGRMARDLLAASRVACTGGATSAAHVPLVRASWACLPADVPRVVASLPGGAGVLSAAALAPSDDLRSLDAEDVHVLLPGELEVRIAATRVRVRGLAPFARASNLPPAARAAVLAASSALAALLAAWAVVRLGTSSRTRSLVLGAAGPASALLVLAALERGATPAPAYAAVPAAALAGVVAAAVVMRGTTRAPARRRR